MPIVKQPGRFQSFISGIGTILIALFFISLGYASWRFSIDAWKRSDCESWPKATGVIVDADIVHTTLRSRRHAQESNSFAVRFKYEYSVNGQAHTGTSDGESHSSQWEAEDEFRRKLDETGTEVSVSYFPGDPSISTLSPRNTSILVPLVGFAFALAIGLLIGGSGVLMGIGLLLSALFPQK